MRYEAFGLDIVSDIRLAGLRPATAGKVRPVFTIVRQELGQALPPAGAEPRFDYSDPAGVLMIWPGVIAVRIIGVDRAEVQPYPGVPDEYLELPLLGPVLGWVLHQQGHLVLHASAIEFEGRSIAFAGDKMAGKSTTAAAFLRAGGRLLTDDLLTIEMSDAHRPCILPAYAQIKLSDEAAREVQVPHSHALPLIFEGFPKRQHRLDGMYADPIRIHAVMILERVGDQPHIQRLRGSEALTSLIRYSYNVRFANAPSAMQHWARHFQACADLASNTAIGRLCIPANLERLEETVQYVLSRVWEDEF